MTLPQKVENLRKKKQGRNIQGKIQVRFFKHMSVRGNATVFMLA